MVLPCDLPPLRLHRPTCPDHAYGPDRPWRLRAGRDAWRGHGVGAGRASPPPARARWGAPRRTPRARSVPRDPPPQRRSRPTAVITCDGSLHAPQGTTSPSCGMGGDTSAAHVGQGQVASKMATIGAWSLGRQEPSSMTVRHEVTRSHRFHDYVVVLPWLRAVTVRVGAHVSAAGRVRADAVRGGHLVWRDRPRVGQAERGEPFQHVAVPLAVGRVQLVEMLRSPASTSGRGERTRPRRSISGVRGRDRRMPPGSRPHGGTARPQPRRAPMAWPHRDTTTSRRAQRHHGDAVRTHPTPHHPKRQRPRPAAADPPDRADHPLPVPGRNRDPVAPHAGAATPADKLLIRPASRPGRTSDRRRTSQTQDTKSPNSWVTPRPLALAQHPHRADASLTAELRWR